MKDTLESYLDYLNEFSNGLHTYGGNSKSRLMVHRYRAAKDVQYSSCSNRCRNTFAYNQVVERRNCIMKCLYDYKKRNNLLNKGNVA